MSSSNKRIRQDSQKVSTFQWESNSPCEDTFAVVQKGDSLFLAIFDGHGGPGVSEYCKNSLADHLDDNVDSLATVLASMETAIGGRTDLQWQGSTAALACLDKHGHLQTATLGDSRIYVGVRPRQGDEMGTVQMVCMRYCNYEVWATHIHSFLTAISISSHAHNANEPKEQLYVQQRFPALASLLRNEDGTIYWGTLQTTRSLGDFYMKSWNGFSAYATAFPKESAPLSKALKKANLAGSKHWKPLVSAEPDCDQDLLDDAQFVLLASDGLFDNVSADLALHLIASWGPLQEDPAARLGKVALEKAAFKAQLTLTELLAYPKGTQTRAVVDDISIIVCWLE